MNPEDLSRLHAAIDRMPDDLVLRLALADCYEEQGDLKRAQFHRYLAEFDKRPMQGIELAEKESQWSVGVKAFRWFWWTGGWPQFSKAYLGFHSHAAPTSWWRREGHETRQDAEEAVFLDWDNIGTHVLGYWRSQRGKKRPLELEAEVVEDVE